MANVFITGCSSGFGLLTALRFARAGDRVVATMRRPEEAPAELTGPIARERLPIRLDRLDVLVPASIDAAVRAAGDVDVLVNNAGIELRSSIEDASDEDVEKQFDTNVFGMLRVLRAVLPQMRARKRGTRGRSAASTPPPSTRSRRSPSRSTSRRRRSASASS
jgi:NAD(P)-dependent dehydrogenase (short-subunit alcohol dehydrogenase family)